MTQVLEYITQNYTLFLFGAIVILLAVIGYYAEKTNFGQGKTEKTKSEENNQMSSKSDDSMYIDNNIEEQSKVSVDSNIKNNAENLLQDESSLSTGIDYAQNIINDKETTIETNLSESNQVISEQIEEKKEIVNPIIDAIHKELNLVSNDVIFNAEEIKKKETKNKKREEAFNKFSDEFDALLPKREIISDDLLSEIDDLELGKTQKFNLKDFKRFDNIKLPRISDTATEEQDIWKI